MPATLPSIPDPSRWWMIRFETVSGNPTSVAALVRALGLMTALRAGLGVFRRQVFGPDPLAKLGPDNPADIEDWLARRQLRPLLWLDAALSEDLALPDEQRIHALSAVVGATGAAFLNALFPRIDPTVWPQVSAAERETFVRRTFRRFGNIGEADVRVHERGVRFDVRACRFHRMVVQLERPDLGPLFCAADGVFFGRADAPYRFERTTTRAAGGSVCDFQLTWKDDPSN